MVQGWLSSSWEAMSRDLIFQIVSTVRLEARLRLVALSVLFLGFCAGVLAALKIHHSVADQKGCVGMRD